MQATDLIERFVLPLADAEIRYVVSGSVAAMLYGEPRMTNDVDVIVFLRLEDVRKLEKAFPANEYYLPPADVLISEIARSARGHFNILHNETGMKADVYLAKRDELHGWAFRNKVTITTGGKTIFLAPPEYVIVRKLQFYEEGGAGKHLRDIRTILRTSGARIDQQTLAQFIRERGLETVWAEVEEEGPEGRGPEKL